MTPGSKICAKHRVEEFPDDFCRRKYIILQVLSP